MSAPQPTTTPTGISARSQAILMIIASILASVGSVQLVLGSIANSTIGIIIGIVILVLGAIGMGIKEALKSLPGN